jgi:hypothetical protein
MQVHDGKRRFVIAWRPFTALVLIVGLLVSGMIEAQSENPYARPATGEAAHTKGSNMDGLTSFATGGARILDSKFGDIGADGRMGAVLVLDPPSTGYGKLGEGAARDVVILARDAAGHLRKVASNKQLVPCETCGGIAGDPYGYMRVAAGQFTIVIGGGSRERWTDAYTFTYVGAKKDWFVSSVVRKVVDTDTDKEKHVDLTAKELGTVSFSDFDPSTLPEVTLP